MDALCVTLGNGLVDGGIDGAKRHGVFLGDGVGHQHTALQAHVVAGFEGGSQLLRAVHAVVHAEAGLAGVEGGQLIGAVANDGHALGFQILQRQTQIQNGLGAGADYHDGRLGQLFQVGGDVHSGFRAPMHAADAAGGENLDARHVGDHHGGGDGGGAVLTPGAQDGDVPAGGLGNGLSLLAEVLDFRSRQTGLQPPADDGDGGGYRAVLPDDLLHIQRGLHILGVGHTVGDDGGFQRYHRLARGNGGGDFGVDIQILVHVHMCHSFSFVSLECEV